jgi:hypothetical protein
VQLGSYLNNITHGRNNNKILLNWENIQSTNALYEHIQSRVNVDLLKVDDIVFKKIKKIKVIKKSNSTLLNNVDDEDVHDCVILEKYEYLRWFLNRDDLTPNVCSILFTQKIEKNSLKGIKLLTIVCYIFLFLFP